MKERQGRKSYGGSTAARSAKGKGSNSFGRWNDVNSQSSRSGNPQLLWSAPLQCSSRKVHERRLVHEEVLPPT